MLAGEWESIKTVFEAALNVTASERDAYLDEACAGKPELRRTVADLIVNHLEAGGFLEDLSLHVRRVFASGDLVAGRFRITRYISSGGMGEVYEAYDEKLRLRLALKTLRSQLGADTQALERFRREIRIAREVSHENLCRVFDLVEHVDGSEDASAVVPCLTMQMLDGENLQAYLKRNRPLTVAAAMPLIRQISGAVQALHARGIVHRDLKPSNIILTGRSDGGVNAVVMDFGLAKTLNGDQEVFESQVEFQAGAPYFMAPELLRGGRPSVASDIYALGMVIDEMVTRTRAFTADSVQALYYQKLHETPLAAGSRADGLPREWEQAILRCLKTEPEQRFANALDVVRALEGELTPAPAVTAVVASTGRLRRATWLGLGTLLLLLVLALGRLLLKPIDSSVVVFPIDNLTNQAQYNYLCKGITAEVMRRLTLIDGVRIIPFYDSRSSAPQRLSNARFSLAGMLQVFNGRVRLTAQLTDNRDEALVWSQNFEREIHNPLDLQSDMAEGTVRALEERTFLGPVTVSHAGFLLVRPLFGFLGLQSAAVPRPATMNGAAFEYYIRGRDLLDERNVPSVLEAIRCFESALVADPRFALAESALADSQLELMNQDYAPNADLQARMRDYAEKAVEFGPNVAEAQASLAAVLQTSWDYQGAEEHYKAALRLNPRFARAHRWYGGMMLQFGRFDEALREMQQAMELDPYDLPGQAFSAVYLYWARRYPEALALAEKVLARKELIQAHIVEGDVYFDMALHSSGANSEALFAKALHQADLVEQAMRQADSLAPRPSAPASYKAADRMHVEYYTMSGNPQAARPYFERLLTDAESGRTSPVNLAMVYAVLGEGAKAMDLLERSAAYKDRQLMYIKVSPQFDRLRNLDRFQALLKKMEL